MQNVSPGSIGLTGDRVVPIIRRVPIAASDPGIIRKGSPITTQPVAQKPPNDTPLPVQSGTPQTENPPKDYGMPWGAGLTPPSWWTQGVLNGSIIPNGAPAPSSVSGNGNTPIPPVTPGPTDSGNSQDPVLQGLLSALGGGGGSGTTLPAGQGLTPSGLIGSAQPASGGSSAAVIIVLVIVAVLGYYLWERYKGKLKKHEEN